MPESAADPHDCLLIVSVAARALAQSARRSGWQVHTLDLFADQDTRALSLWSGKVAAARCGLDLLSLRQMLQLHRQEFGHMPVVVGSGLEGMPVSFTQAVPDALWLANRQSLVLSLKHPVRLARLLNRLGIAHPPVRRRVPGSGYWLIKHWAGLGGDHVRAAMHRSRLSGGDYLQRYCAGMPVSALCLANGHDVRVLACQRALGGNRSPDRFAYSGSVSLHNPSLQNRFSQWAARLVQATSLRGLFGIDAIDSGQGLELLEINPRPPATFELYDSAEQPMLAWHLSGLQGATLPDEDQDRGRVIAQQVFRAPYRLQIPAQTDWPAAVHDRPSAGEKFQKHQPVCTIRVISDNETDALRLLEEHSTDLTRCLPACGPM